MACFDDHLKPHDFETQRQRTCQNLLWLLNDLGEPIPAELEDAADNIYGRWITADNPHTFKDPVPVLCGLIHKVGEDKLLQIMNDNPQDAAAVDTWLWWLQHKAKDAQRADKANRGYENSPLSADVAV